MLRVLAENWWLLALRGVFALAFGLFGFSLRMLVKVPWLAAVAFTSIDAFFAIFALVSGFITVAAAVKGFGEDKWWILLLDGLAAMTVGAVVVLSPALSFSALLRWMAVWGIAVGVLEGVAAIHLRKHISDEWLLGCSGVGSLLFGIFLLVMRPGTHEALLLWVSTFALFSAAAMLALALRLRAWLRQPSKQMA